jgi:hypothetical protein
MHIIITFELPTLQHTSSNALNEIDGSSIKLIIKAS